MLKNFEPTDTIAVLIIVGGFILMALHVNTVVGGIMTVTVGYYFGRKTAR